MRYVDCKSYAQEILDEVKAVDHKDELWILSMGDNSASESYIKGKLKDADYCGVPCSYIKVNDADLLERHIRKGNNSVTVRGMMIQLPLPEGVDTDYYINSIGIYKDIDGFRDRSDWKPCTPEGIMHVLHRELGDLTGKRALVIGRGKLVGIPITAMLLEADCTITVAHSKTSNLDDLLTQNDIIICAAGKPNLVDLKKCKAEIVIDVGINRDANGKLCGDCYNFDENDGSDMLVTSVPNGIGLMTRAMLMRHMIDTDD